MALERLGGKVAPGEVACDAVTDAPFKARARPPNRLTASELTGIVGGREMTSDKIKGKGKEVIGAGKEKLGEMTEDERLQTEGRSQKAEGKVQKTVGKIKDKAKEIKEKVS